MACFSYKATSYKGPSDLFDTLRYNNNNNNNNNQICKAPECQKTSVALEDFRGATFPTCIGIISPPE